MKWLLSILMCGAPLLGVACSSAQQAQTKVQRKPLEKQRREYKSPKTYEHRELGYDPKTGKVLAYDHKPRVELLDEKQGTYALKWIGYDRKEKMVIFQRGDAVDVIVTASVSKTESGAYVYTYELHNLPTSGSYLTTFAVQNRSATVTPGHAGPMVALTMSSDIYRFREGNWLGFYDASDDVQINPGQSVKVKLMSTAIPGLVGCAARGGPLTMEGAGEEMPSVLENLIPGYEEWPSGHTIGPVDRLRTSSAQDQIAYLLENLPQFRKLGWMTDEAFSRYEQRLKYGNLNAILSRIDEDLKTEQISSEVFGIIQAMR